MNNDTTFTNKTNKPIKKNKAWRQKKAERVKYQDFFEWLDVISISLVCVIILFSFVFKVVKISGTSMLNTLNSGEMVVISDFSYKPRYGDIVVISRNVENSAEAMADYKGPIIKRVIATENQVVDIHDGKVFVNGRQLQEDYLTFKYTSEGGLEYPVTVPKGHIFVLGDNRGNSQDSRNPNLGENGMIDSRYVLGHAIYRIFPLDKLGSLEK